MRRALPAVVGALLLSACGPTTLRGRVVDPMNGEAPLAGEILLAKAVGAVPLTCQTLAGTTDDDGRFEIPGLCLRETAYRILPSNKALLFADADPIGETGGEIVLRAWWAPEGEGTWILRGRTLVSVPIHAELGALKVGDQAVAYPKTMPDAPPVVGPSDHLVISGVESVGPVVIGPLVPSPARTIDGTPMAPWSYVGARFVDDTTVERVAVEPDPAKVREVKQDDRSVRYVAGDAVPPGRYAVYQPGKRKASIVQFGAPPPPAPTTPPPPPL